MSAVVITISAQAGKGKSLIAQHIANCLRSHGIDVTIKDIDHVTRSIGVLVEGLRALRDNDTKVFIEQVQLPRQLVNAEESH